MLDKALELSKHPDGLLFASFNIGVDDDGVVKIEQFGDKPEQSGDDRSEL